MGDLKGMDLVDWLSSFMRQRVSINICNELSECGGILKWIEVETGILTEVVQEKYSVTEPNKELLQYE